MGCNHGKKQGMSCYGRWIWGNPTCHLLLLLSLGGEVARIDGNDVGRYVLMPSGSAGIFFEKQCMERARDNLHP